MNAKSLKHAWFMAAVCILPACAEKSASYCVQSQVPPLSGEAANPMACTVDLPHLEPQTWDDDLDNIEVLVPAFSDCASAFRSSVIQYLNTMQRQNAPCTTSGESP